MAVMKYYINLFSPNTATAFTNSNRDVTGFRISRKSYVKNQGIKSGDIFICYCTKIQRFIGILEVISAPYEDNSPIFIEENDPFCLRFKVKPLVWLPFELAIPIHEDLVWNTLSITKDLPKDSTKWTYKVFSSPLRWDNADGKFLVDLLKRQAKQQTIYPLSEKDAKKIKASKIRIISGKETIVSVPDDDAIQEKDQPQTEQRESIKVQAKLAKIGEIFGFKIWLPKADRNRVTEFWHPKESTLLDELPIIFDETTLKTIKNIDVLWIQRRSIVRAFEVEGTTSIYSGILRMADLLSLQPMLDIKIHIVASEERREAVLEQITRPVFAVMERGPLADICSYISYSSIDEILKEKRLSYMTDDILKEFETEPKVENKSENIRNVQENFLSLSEIKGTVENTQLNETQAEVFNENKTSLLKDAARMAPIIEKYRKSLKEGGLPLNARDQIKLNKWAEENPDAYNKIC